MDRIRWKNKHKPRVFLFLQGPPSAFARELGDHLEKNGHTVLRINFCAGDWLYWLGRPAVNYRGSLQNWEAYLSAFVVSRNVTDILYYADRQPYHRIAAKVARQQNIAAITYEFGYLRPDWITLEHNGMSGHSHFPDDPDTIRRLATILPSPDMSELYKHKFRTEAVNEVVYNLTTFFLPFFFPNYKADKYYNSLVNYLSYVPRLLSGGRNIRKAASVIENLAARQAAYFVAPLQMQSDYQLRANSPYRHQSEMIGQLIRSFAQTAPAAAELVFKLHPLDNGLENWARVVQAAARKAGIPARVHVIDGGCLQTLLKNARGTIVINSTVGLHALRAGCPVKVLGMALFDIAGLTHQGSLEDFWRAPVPPDAALCDALVRLLAASIQVKGSFYHRQGRAAAIAAITGKLEMQLVNQPGALISPPPRLAKARALGVPFCDWNEPFDAVTGAEQAAHEKTWVRPTVSTT